MFHFVTRLWISSSQLRSRTAAEPTRLRKGCGRYHAEQKLLLVQQCVLLAHIGDTRQERSCSRCDIDTFRSHVVVSSSLVARPRSCDPCNFMLALHLWNDQCNLHRVVQHPGLSAELQPIYLTKFSERFVHVQTMHRKIQCHVIKSCQYTCPSKHERAILCFIQCFALLRFDLY